MTKLIKIHLFILGLFMFVASLTSPCFDYASHCGGAHRAFGLGCACSTDGMEVSEKKK